jgi:nucleoside 2-deoxyribosyltransferase
MAVRSVYYARSRETMGTPRDRENLRRVAAMFPAAEIRIVSRRECIADAEKAKSMEPFFKVVDAVDAVVIDEPARGHVPAGVFAEAQHALHQGKPVISLREEGARRVSSLQVTKNAGKEQRQAGNWARVFSRQA